MYECIYRTRIFHHKNASLISFFFPSLYNEIWFVLVGAYSRETDNGTQYIVSLLLQ